jgi:hypothetical protein
MSRLTVLKVTEAKETLGLWIAADGNQTKQFQALLEKIKEWADRIRYCSPLSRLGIPSRQAS